MTHFAGGAFTCLKRRFTFVDSTPGLTPLYEASWFDPNTLVHPQSYLLYTAHECSDMSQASVSRKFPNYSPQKTLRQMDTVLPALSPPLLTAGDRKILPDKIALFMGIIKQIQ